MKDVEPSPFSARRKRFRRRRLVLTAVALATAVLALFVDETTALHLKDGPLEGDAKVYSRIADNVIDQGVFSAEDQPDQDHQFPPTIIRLPGYPLFLAAIYSIAGTDSYSTVQTVQGALHFGSALLAAMLAFSWAGSSRKRRRGAAFFAFVLAAFCPFTINYSAVLLTEVVTIFLLMAMTLFATFAIKNDLLGRSLIWWTLCGFVAGLAVEVRPDAGLFAFGLGLTVVVAAIMRYGFRSGTVSALARGGVFSAAFVLVLVPWTIRNERVFGQFQPLAPRHAEAPGEFVPLGYFAWLRTWVDDPRYVGPMLWDLEIHRIDTSKIPASAYADDEERAEVAALFDQYNNSDPDHPLDPKPEAADSDNDSDTNDDTADPTDDNSDQDPADSDDDQSDDELDLHITPESDAAFADIARRRITNDPINYYVKLPGIRSAKMWFDAHADFYPFAGGLFPLKDLDTETYQHVWLPLFFGLVWLYTLLAIGGIILILLGRWPRGTIWIAMDVLSSLPRIVFFGTLENPEPRYLIELFFIVAILGGIALSRVSVSSFRGRVGIVLEYARRR
jgi:hypothetical protein